MLDTKSISNDLLVRRRLWVAEAEISDSARYAALRSIGLPTLSTLRARVAFLSPGEKRKLCLLAARLSNAQLLILDEPSQDLDEQGRLWLEAWLKKTRSGLIVASHDRRVLRCVRHYFVVSESGCQLVEGSLEELECQLAQTEIRSQRQYARRLNTLVQREADSEQFRRRREQKKNVGRTREVGRLTPRVRLNQKRSCAQEKQGRIKSVRESRMAGLRA
ncbi:MAG: ABC-F family ATP-binding cassette domain-containing protein [Chromatiales bacterium]|nr:ABC-F family ATP-binding cassette domain-containing protein [Chromatiales bacterium]